jgi:predicted signal transduction protein with EAL and GGDEF domain
LNLEVVVEGVETYRQADYFSLVEQKVYAQGWLYGHPMTAEQFVDVLAGEVDLGFATTGTEVAYTTKPGALRIVGAMTA